MALDAEAWKLVHEALLDAFVTWDDLDLMVAKGLGKNLHAIASDKLNLNAAVTALLKQADSEGYLPNLLRAAHDERPGNPKLVGAVRAHAAPPLRFAGATLRATAPPIEPPRRPYPLLEAYRHPAAFTGRDRELRETLDELHVHRLLLCLHAASGAGKTSFLQAGLLPRLRSDGVPVVINREPDEPGIARRLAAGLLDLPDGSRLADDDLRGFVHLLDQCEKLAKKAPVIVLDQFEDAFRRSESGEALARLGPLLVASTELGSPDGSGFRCRWVLSYRQEYHGEVVEWLRDVLSDARAGGRADLKDLPHDLSRPKYFHEMPIGPLGGAVSPEQAKAVFLNAITTPLDLADENGKKRYPYQFEDGGAGRLADAFADARGKLRERRSFPELQVVLDQRLREAKPGADGVAVVTVPKDVRGLVEDALGKYLEEALRRGFSGDDAKRQRALALIALRALADAEGRRGKGIAPAELEKRLGAKNGAVLSVLQDKRLVVRDAEGPEGGDWVLPHDQMAGVIVALWGDAEKRKRFEIDEEVIALQEKVRRRIEMHRAGEEEGVALPAELFKRVEATRGNLLWDDDCEAWWTACVEWRRALWRSRLRAGVVGLAVLLPLVALVWRQIAIERFRSAIGDARNIEAAWDAYQEGSKIPGGADKAKRAYAEFLIRESQRRAFHHDFPRALLLRLKANEMSPDIEGNMREAGYLASLFPDDSEEDYYARLFPNPREAALEKKLSPNQRKPWPPPPAKAKWAVPNGKLPDASSTGFLGDYVLTYKSTSAEPMQLWSTREQSSVPVVLDHMKGSKLLLENTGSMYFVIRDGSAGLLVVQPDPSGGFYALPIGNDRNPLRTLDLSDCHVGADAKAAVCSSSDEILLVQFPSGEKGPIIEHHHDHDARWDAAFAKGGARVAVFDRFGGDPNEFDGRPKGCVFTVYDATKGNALLSRRVDRDMNGGECDMKFSPSGRIVWFRGHGFVDVDADRDLCVGSQLPQRFNGLPILDGESRYALLRFEDRIEVWDVSEKCDLKTTLLVRFVDWAEFFPNSRRLAMLTWNAIQFMDMTDNELVPRNTRLIRPVEPYAMRVLPDGISVEVLVKDKDTDREREHVEIQTVTRDLPRDAPVLANPAAQFEKWRKLGLVINEKGEFPAASTPTPTAPSVAP